MDTMFYLQARIHVYLGLGGSQRHAVKYNQLLHEIDSTVRRNEETAKLIQALEIF